MGELKLHFQLGDRTARLVLPCHVLGLSVGDAPPLHYDGVVTQQVDEGRGRHAILFGNAAGALTRFIAANNVLNFLLSKTLG